MICTITGYTFSTKIVKMGSNNGKPEFRDEDIEALSKSSGMSKEEVKKAFDSFIEEHPNGKMKKGDFSKMMALALPQKDVGKMEKHVFRVYDTNNDGFIDFVEFMVIFHIMSDGSPEEVLEKIFRVFDLNSDGSISNKEMERLVKDMYKLLKTEDPTIAAKDMISKSAFAEMDKNEDGKVTLEEFRTACLAKEDFSRMLAIKVIDIFVDEDSN